MEVIGTYAEDAKHKSINNLRIADSTTIRSENTLKAEPSGDPIQCEICRKNFVSKDRLINHKQIQGTEHHDCKQCEISFHSSKNLERHLRDHVEELNVQPTLVDLQKVKTETHNDDDSMPFKPDPGQGSVIESIQIKLEADSLERIHHIENIERAVHTTIEAEIAYTRESSDKPRSDAKGRDLSTNHSESNDDFIPTALSGIQLRCKKSEHLGQNTNFTQNVKRKKNAGGSKSDNSMRPKKCINETALTDKHLPDKIPDDVELYNSRIHPDLETLLMKSLFDLSVKTNNRPTDLRKGEEKQAQCSTCLKVMRSKKHLYDHMRTVHGPKKHICGLCSFAFSRRNDMLRHQRQNHRGISKHLT
ncbi:transcription factor E4F1-like isoform X2 [Armigeres subalbatus]|uniref:transcription factor E4F1-like isoform X2 n=1 Tax=Armigeres subalbatus TaxID=124917 RepID=UPI002ED64748